MAIKISGSTIIDDDRNIVNAGVVTASSFSGDGSQLTGVGVGTEDSINTTGIVTASKISAQEFEGSGDFLVFSPRITSFSPLDGATDVDLNTSIVFTFDQTIYTGVGTITIRNSSGIGTIIESISIGDTSKVSINNQTLTITPSILPNNVDIYTVLPQGIIVNAISGKSALLDTYNFTTVDFALLSINPPNGTTNVAVTTSLTLTFTSPPTQGTGTIEIKSGSTSGATFESFNAATSPRISVSGNNWILTPTSTLGNSTQYFTVIPSGAIDSFTGINTVGTALTHSYTTKPLELGDPFGGGNLICQSGGTRWVVAPSSSQVSRSWYSRNDANTTAQQVSGCTGWFVPSFSQLQNPGYICRTYWEGYVSAGYWSSTPNPDDRFAFAINSTGNQFDWWKAESLLVRSFRCVAY